MTDESVPAVPEFAETSVPGGADPVGSTDAGAMDLGALGGLDLGALMGAAQNMQAQIAETQRRISETIVTGQAGGAMVSVSVTGAFEFQQVSIRPEAIDPDDPALLEDLVLAALRDATARIAALQSGADPLAGLGGALGGMFGGS